MISDQCRKWLHAQEQYGPVSIYIVIQSARKPSR